MKTLIVTPTYNERKNIRELVLTLFELNSDFHILVVDDNSPDGTAEIVEELQTNCTNLHLLSRNEKGGLGSAYIAGFNFALERDYEVIVQMDADMSHDPKDVPLLIEAIENADLSIGSRYISGINVVNWPLQRLIISYGANIYTRFDPSECTTLYHVFCYCIFKSDTFFFEWNSLFLNTCNTNCFEHA